MTKMTIATMLLAATLVSGCHKQADQKAAAPAVVEHGMPLDKDTHGGKPEIVRMHRVAGRWESQPGVTAKGSPETVSLQVTNDMKFSLEMHTQRPDKPLEVGVTVRGAIAWTKDGILTGSGTGANGPLKEFGSWRASFPEQGHMRLAGGTKAYDLTYRGF